MAYFYHAVDCVVSNSDEDELVSVGDCVESNSDSDDDCEECFGIAPYRFEPTNNSPEREMSVKVRQSRGASGSASVAAMLSVQVEVEVGG